MPNWCYSGYTFNFPNEEQAKRFVAIIKKARDAKIEGQGFGPGWLGNILIACGYPYSVEKSDSSDREILHLGNENMPGPKYLYKGSIIYCTRCESEVGVQTETAWAPMPAVLGAALLHAGIHLDTNTGVFDDVEVNWWSEEPGSRLYCGSDAETCDGDIHVLFKCSKSKYETDKRFSDIFTYDANSRYDHDIFSQEFTTRKEYLIKDINTFVYKNDKDSYKDNLDNAVKAIKRAYPDYNIEFDITEYEFCNWLFDDEIAELSKEQDRLFKGKKNEM